MDLGPFNINQLVDPDSDKWDLLVVLGVLMVGGSYLYLMGV